MIQQMILIFFNKFRHKNNMVKRVKQPRNTLEYTILKTSRNLLKNVQVSREPRSNTKLCTSVGITIFKRYGPGKEAGKVAMGAGNNFANPFCRGAQCGIRPTVIATNNNRNVPQTNALMQQRNFNDQHAPRIPDVKFRSKNFNSLVEQINRSSLENPSGAQGITTTTVTTQQEVTTINETHQRLYQEAVTPLQNNTSTTESQSQTSHVNNEKETMDYHNNRKPSEETQANMTKLGDELKNIQAKQQPSENNPDSSIKPSTIKGLINNTKEPLTTQENNFRNNSVPVSNTDISQAEPLVVPDSDISLIPLIPPLLPNTGLDTNTNSTPVDTVSDVKMDSTSLKESLQSHIPIPPELIDNLIKRNLLTLENGEEKTTQKFNDFLQKVYVEKKLVVFDAFKPFKFELGLLQIINEHETVLLYGKQKHVVVFCVLQDTKRLAFSMLTSTKDGTILLSNYQPFSTDEDKNRPKKQYLATFEIPILVENSNYYKPLNSSNIYYDKMTQQELGQSYIDDPEIKNKIHNNFLKKTLAKIQTDKGYVVVYNGEGITMDDITNIMQKDDAEREKKIKKHFQNYKQYKNQLSIEDLQKKLKNMQKDADEKTWELLRQKINEYENKI